MESFDLRSKVWSLVDTVRLQLSAVQALHGRIGFSLEQVFVSSDSACRTGSSSIFDEMGFSFVTGHLLAAPYLPRYIFSQGSLTVAEACLP